MTGGLVMDPDTFLARDDLEEAALAVLCAWPGMLHEVADCVYCAHDPDLDRVVRVVDWAAVAEAALDRCSSSGERAFLGICAELAGCPVRYDACESFGTRLATLDARPQQLVARALAHVADAALAHEQAARRVFGS